MTAHCYRDLVDRPETELRDLVRSGDAPSRVYACWALALQLGGGASTLVREHIDVEPSAGVRRHLVGVLTGLGERTLVRTLAERDPDPYVRATAVSYAARVMSSEAERQAWWLARLASDAAPELLQTAIDTVAPSRAMADALDARLGDASPTLRSEIVGWLDANILDVDVALLERHAVAESDAALRARMARIVAKRDPDVLARIDLATARSVVDRLRHEAGELRWDELAPFAERPDAVAADRAIAVAIVGFARVPLTTALAAVLETGSWGYEWDGFEPLLARAEREGLDAVGRAHLEALVEDMRAYVVSMTADDPYDDHASERRRFEAEMDRALRLLDT